MNKQDIITNMDINITLFDFLIAETRYIRIYYMVTFAIHSLVVLLVFLYDKNLAEHIISLYSVFVLKILMYKGYSKEIDEIIDSSKNKEEVLERLKKLKIEKGIERGVK